MTTGYARTLERIDALEAASGIAAPKTFPLATFVRNNAGNATGPREMGLADHGAQTACVAFRDQTIAGFTVSIESKYQSGSLHFVAKIDDSPAVSFSFSGPDKSGIVDFAVPFRHDRNSALEITVQSKSFLPSKDEVTVVAHGY